MTFWVRAATIILSGAMASVTGRGAEDKPLFTARQAARGSVNASLAAGRVREVCPLDAAAERTLEMAVHRLALSARAHDRILKVARTIADLGASDAIQAKHIAEAVQYRSLDREYWK
jgi:magnesium chelatase family protein